MSKRSLLAVAAFLIAVVRPALAHDWNDAGIKWRPYEEAMAEARKDRKPICLVVFTEWCPHCKNYSAVFHDPKVVDAAKTFVMVRVDNDKSPAVAGQYAPDGEYVPRTYFLSSDGKVDPSIHIARPQFQYFYDESNPTSLLAGMEIARKKLK